jgi:hypothetical protein
VFPASVFSRVFAKPRTGYKRSCLWILGFVNFVYTLAGQEAGVLIGQYALFELNWDTTKYSDWTTQGLVIGK